MTISSSGFGFEIEVTAKVAKLKCAIYEVPISYHGRTYEQGKKVGLKDGFAALWYIVRFNLFCSLEKSYRTLPRQAPRVAGSESPQNSGENGHRMLPGRKSDRRNGCRKSETRSFLREERTRGDPTEEWARVQPVPAGICFAAERARRSEAQSRNPAGACGRLQNESLRHRDLLCGPNQRKGTFPADMRSGVPYESRIAFAADARTGLSQLALHPKCLQNLANSSPTTLDPTATRVGRNAVKAQSGNSTAIPSKRYMNLHRSGIIAVSATNGLRTKASAPGRLPRTDTGSAYRGGRNCSSTPWAGIVRRIGAIAGTAWNRRELTAISPVLRWALMRTAIGADNRLAPKRRRRNRVMKSPGGNETRRRGKRRRQVLQVHDLPLSRVRPDGVLLNFSSNRIRVRIARRRAWCSAIRFLTRAQVSSSASSSRRDRSR